jgi:hypothetical protein
LGGAGVEIGEATAVSIVFVGETVGVSCKVIVATEPTEFWSVGWVSKPSPLGMLQDKSIAANAKAINKSLFEFAFSIFSSYHWCSLTISISQRVLCSASWGRLLHQSIESIRAVLTTAT